MSRLSDERGFTLVELIVTIAILGVITLPIGNFVIEYFWSTTDTTARAAASHDEQIAAAYFAQDIASLGVHGTGASASTSLWTGSVSGAPGCATAVTGAVNVMTIGMDDYWKFASETAGTFDRTKAPDTTYIAYYVLKIADSPHSTYELHRMVCTGTSSTTGPDIVLMHNVSAVPASPSCDDVGCSASTPYPSRVSWNVDVWNDRKNGTLPILLSGQRRQS